MPSGGPRRRPKSEPNILEIVILSEAKDLLFATDSRSFASLRMTKSSG